MAKQIILSREKNLNYQEKKAPIGFSWTTLFFGFIPSLLRKDWLNAAILSVWFIGKYMLSISLAMAHAEPSVIALMSGATMVVNFMFAFIINKSYARKLIRKGWQVNWNKTMLLKEHARTNIQQLRQQVYLVGYESHGTF